jgi:glycerol-1-phosphate dehydrogenase [NAD(P)+]
MRELSDLSTYLDLSPAQLADTALNCPECHRVHKIPFKIVKSGRGLVSQIPDVAKTILGRSAMKIGVVFDREIENKVIPLFIDQLTKEGIPLVQIPLGEKGRLLDPSVAVGDQAAENLPDGVDFLIGVGSGVISDLTKWIATQHGLPFALVGTAASMNAYTSITATMTKGKVKTSCWLDPASAVLLDADLLATAPPEMTCAGIGDLLARNISNADWKLSELVRGTYFCSIPFQMMIPYQNRFLSEVDALGKNQPEAIAFLGDAVLVSGYSMTVLDGETSPSSGSEHILSHFFDFQHEVFHLPKNLHGTQVGLGTIIMSAAFEILREMDPEEFDIDDIERRRLSQTAINLDHRRVFGENGKKFDLVVADKRVQDVSYRDYVNGILENWEDIWAAIDPYLMATKTLREAMEKSGGVTKLSGIKRSKEDAVQALLYGSHYRPRYSILDLFWELGLFPSIAPEILARAEVLN